MKVQLSSNGQVIQQFYTFNSGGYSFKTDSLTNYEVVIDTTGLPFYVACPSTGLRAVSLNPMDSVAMKQDFGLKCSGSDYAVTNLFGRFRPTFTRQVHISAGEHTYIFYGASCGNASSGTVTTTLSGPVSYVSAAPGALTPTSISGQTLTYTLADLDALVPGSLDIMVATDSNAVIGAPVCITSIISSATPDINPSDDALTWCSNVVNSYDPNHKDVSPAQIAPGSTDWLTYTVEFQNTGNDTAYTVVVRDTLSSDVDAASFQYLASDHKAVIQLFGPAVVFTFPRINLVDSGTNPALSTGWIQYRVRSKPNLPLGRTINNTAYIYFDNNAAVVTNTARSIVSISGISTVKPQETMIRLYPNPNKGIFTLQTTGNIRSQYIISDMLGHIVAQQIISADRQDMNLSHLADGVYTLSVYGEQPVRFAIVK